MPSKTEEYLALAQRTADGLTRYWESWTDYRRRRQPYRHQSGSVQRTAGRAGQVCWHL